MGVVVHFAGQDDGYGQVVQVGDVQIPVSAAFPAVVDKGNVVLDTGNCGASLSLDSPLPLGVPLRSLGMPSQVLRGTARTPGAPPTQPPGSAELATAELALAEPPTQPASDGLKLRLQSGVVDRARLGPVTR